MKLTAVLIAVMVMSGCAEKKRAKVKPQMFVTKDCIVGFTKASQCKTISPDSAICHDVVMKIACVRVNAE